MKMVLSAGGPLSGGRPLGGGDRAVIYFDANEGLEIDDVSSLPEERDGVSKEQEANEVTATIRLRNVVEERGMQVDQHHLEDLR